MNTKCYEVLKEDPFSLIRLIKKKGVIFRAGGYPLFRNQEEVIKKSGISIKSIGDKSKRQIEVTFPKNTEMLVEERLLENNIQGDQQLEWRDHLYACVKGFIFFNEKYSMGSEQPFGGGFQTPYSSFSRCSPYAIAVNLGGGSTPEVRRRMVEAGWFPKSRRGHPNDFLNWTFPDGQTLEDKFPIAYKQ